MTTTCVRCPTAPNATLTYAYDRREAWIFDTGTGRGEGTSYPMCGSHADRVTTPIGWVLHDRRSASTEADVA